MHIAYLENSLLQNRFICEFLITMLNHRQYLFLVISYRFCLFGECVEVFEREVWCAQVAHLHSVVICIVRVGVLKFHTVLLCSNLSSFRRRKYSSKVPTDINVLSCGPKAQKVSGISDTIGKSPQSMNARVPHAIAQFALSKGNRTDWSPIRSHLFITSMITDWIGRHEDLLSIDHKNYNFQEKEI